MDIFLKSALSGAKYKKLLLTKQGSDRQYIRIKTARLSWVLAHSPIKQQKYFLLRLKDFSSAGLNVPKLIAQDQKKGFLLLEDLGNQDLEKEVLENREFPFAYYCHALDQIIKLQSGVQSTLWPSFTRENFFKEMLWTEKYLINHLFDLKLNKNFRELYLKEFLSVCEQLSAFPYLPAHRDCHSRNLFIKNKKLYLIDFQDAAFFPRFYDPVSLLYDVYVSSKIKNKDREKMLNYFLLKNGFSEKKITKKIREEISIIAMQRLFKVCGSFAGFYSLKKQNTHLKYIYPALQMLEKLLQEQKNNYPVFLKLIEELLQKAPKRLKEMATICL